VNNACKEAKEAETKTGRVCRDCWYDTRGRWNAADSKNLSDEEKWMYLAFRNEMRLLIAWELIYNYYWMDHVLRMMSGSDHETLTMRFEDEEEDRKDEAIDRLIKRQKYDKAFDVATGSSFFCF